MDKQLPNRGIPWFAEQFHEWAIALERGVFLCRYVWCQQVDWGLYHFTCQPILPYAVDYVHVNTSSPGGCKCP